MPKGDIVFNAFTGGEIAPEFEGRTDLELYYKSCRLIENFLVLPSGGAIRRPGTEYLDGTKDNSDARLIPFIIDVSNVPTLYLLVLTPSSIKIMKNDAYISGVDITSPWATMAQIRRIKYRQTQTAMYFFVNDESPRKLTRTSDTTWNFGTVSSWGSGAPDFNGTEKPGAVCMFGQRMWLSGIASAPSRLYGSKPGSIEDFGSDRLTFDIYCAKPIHISSLIERNEVIFIGDNSQGALSGRGLAISDTNYKISVESELDALSDPAPQGVVMNDRAIFFQKTKIREFMYEEQRQGWSVPEITFHASHISNGNNFVEGAVSTSPYGILWACTSGGEIVCLTYEGDKGTVAFTRYVTDGEVKSIVCPWGTSELYIVVKRGSSYYIEKTKSIYHWTDVEDAWYVDSGKKTVLPSGVPVTGITQASPVTVSSTLGASLSDGDKVKLYGMNGAVELYGVWTVKNPSGTSFQLDETDDAPTWDSSTTYYKNNMVVYSSVNYICLEENTNKQPDVNPDYWSVWPSAYVSGGYASKVVNTVSGLDHLEGKTVSVLADGGRHPDRTVSSGSITLQGYYSKVVVGIPYTSKLEPMRLVPPGRKKTITWCAIRFIKTVGGKVGPSEDEVVELRFRTGAHQMDEPIPPFTGDYELTFPTGYTADGDIMILQDDPLPMHVVMIMAEVETNAVR